MTDVAPDPMSLLDWATRLVADPDLRARFAADAHGVLAEAGLGDLDPADLQHVLPLVTDSVAARFDTTVAADPVVLDGEQVFDTLARQMGAVSDAVVSGAADGSPADRDEIDDPDDPDWTESFLDDLAGAPDGVEGLEAAVPDLDLDVDGVGDLDGHPDHGTDAIARLDGDHDLDGSPAHVPAVVPTVSFLPTAAPPVPQPAVPAASPSEDAPAATGASDDGLDGHADTDLVHDGDQPSDEHQHSDHTLDEHDWSPPEHDGLEHGLAH